MELHVLGCDGGALLNHKPSSFLLDGTILFDAGSICAGLTIEEISRIDHVFISHTHLDHIRDLGLMSDLLTGKRSSPVQIYGTQSAVDVLRAHYFNDQIWPDFTRIPDLKQPVMQLNVIEPMVPITLGAYQILPVPVNHTIECTGFLMSGPGGSLLYSADTGPTDTLWQVANSCSDLKGIILDVAFPTRLQFLANISKHLSPSDAASELQKLNDQTIPIYFFHLKPAFFDELVQELQPILTDSRRILRPDDRIPF
jgi:cAMP phosphodiesterase